MSESNKNYVIRKRNTYEPDDQELKKIISMVEGKKKPRAIAKVGFEFCHYQDKTYFGQLVSFCNPYIVQKTKKFKKTGLVNFLGPRGANPICLMDYIVKVDEMNFLVLNEQAFHSLFSIED